jgi:hypothetical protein
MRRIGTVRLAARSEMLVRRGALLLEDALRTASFPAAGPGRVLLIRTLPIGTIQSHLPPASLALAIEQRVRELAFSAVHGEEASAVHRDAVFFRDDAEPPVALARRLAQGKPVDAWFWRLALPDFHPSLPREEALRLTLSAALRTSAGPAAVARLVEHLHTVGGLEVLLAALRRQEGLALLRAFGGSLPGASPPFMAAPVEEVPPPALQATVARWVKTWSAGDARSVWLAAMALAIARPWRLAHVRLFEQAWHLAARLEAGTLLPAEPDSPAEADLSPGEPRPTPAPAFPPSEPSPPPPASQVESPRPGASGQAAPSASGQAAPSASGQAAPSASASAASTAAATSAATSQVPRPPGRRVELPSAGHGTLEEAATPSGQPTASLPEWPDVPRPTAVGGLFFLVPLFEHLGLPTLLQEYPALLEQDLPERLFAFIAGRLGASPADPSRVILRAGEQAFRRERCPFALPPRMRLRVAAEGEPVTLRTGPSGERTLLIDASGRLPLSVTYEGAPGHEPSPPSGQLLPALHEEEDVPLLLRALLTAARRWCRRQARMGLHTLVHRPGRIVATRTHIDVLFDIQQADMRVRSVGLDVDPGWVPWLGRVVRFHYLYGEA